MKIYKCNHCKKNIKVDDADCVRIEIGHGEKAIRKEDVSYSHFRWSADLCGECFKKIVPLIDKSYNEMISEE